MGKRAQLAEVAPEAKVAKATPKVGAAEAAPTAAPAILATTTSPSAPGPGSEVTAKAAFPGGASTSPSAPAQQRVGVTEHPAPVVCVDVQPPGPAPPPMPPVLPSSEEAGTYDEEKTTVLMRAVYAYNRYHVRRTMKEDRKWFSSWTDQPIHMHQPLVIRRPERKEDLLSYVAPWRKDEAVTSFLSLIHI